MKKEIIIVVIIVILIFAGHILTQNYTKVFFDDIMSDVNISIGTRSEMKGNFIKWTRQI